MSKQTGQEQDSFLSQLFFVNKEKLGFFSGRNIARWSIWLLAATGITAVMVFFPWSWPSLAIGYKVLIPALVLLTELLVVALVKLAMRRRGGGSVVQAPAESFGSTTPTVAEVLTNDHLQVVTFKGEAEYARYPADAKREESSAELAKEPGTVSKDDNSSRPQSNTIPSENSQKKLEAQYARLLADAERAESNDVLPEELDFFLKDDSSSRLRSSTI